MWSSLFKRLELGRKHRIVKFSIREGITGLSSLSFQTINCWCNNRIGKSLLWFG